MIQDARLHEIKDFCVVGSKIGNGFITFNLFLLTIVVLFVSVCLFGD
jgi:hypothetical protein